MEDKNSGKTESSHTAPSANSPSTNSMKIDEAEAGSNQSSDRNKIRFSRSILVKIGLIVFCLVSVSYLGKWYRAVPKARSGNNIISIDLNKPSLKFFALGDTGTGDKNQLKVAESMERRCKEIGGIDGLILLGDNFYFAGVESPSDSQWKTKIEIPYGSECLSNAPIYPVLGNHDYKGNVEAQINYSSLNSRWRLPYRFYRIDFGKMLRLIAFDSGFPDMCFMDGICSVDFLTSSLSPSPSGSNSEPTWKIVAAHHPLNSSSVKGYGHSGGLFGFLMKPLVCDKADLWISGHSHHLEHRLDNGCSTDLIVSGAGGAGLYPVKERTSEVNFAESIYGYTELEITEEKIAILFLDTNEKVIYSSSRSK